MGVSVKQLRRWVYLLCAVRVDHGAHPLALIGHVDEGVGFLRIGLTQGLSGENKYISRVCCQSISETLNESRKRTRTFSGLFVRIYTLT